VGTIDIDKDKKCRQIAGKFDHHADAAVRCEPHHPMEHVLGITRNHWMPSSGKCLCHIAPAAAMINDSDVKHKTLTQNYF
jgi:hypothetical protein